jgi:cysteine-S-conjugate beta-lyase
MPGPAPETFDRLSLDALRRRRSEKWRVYPPDVLPAWVAEMDFPLAEPVKRALHEAVAADDCGYVHPADLADAFAAFAGDRLGWPVDPGRVTVVPDVMVGVAEVLRVVTAPGDGVAINPPVYPPFFATLADLGRRTVEVPMIRAAGGFELDLDGLRDAFAAGARALLLCNPHNPTGRVLARAELEAVAELAGRHGAVVVADEVHAPLTLAGAAHTSWGCLGGAAELGIVVTSASKAWNFPGLKCAVVVAGSRRTQELVAGIPREVRYGAGHLGLLASVAAFRDGGPWLDALLAHLDRNRRLLADLLGARLPAVGYRPPQASYLAWLDCAGLGLGDDPAAVFLERGRVALSHGPDFGRPGAGFARLNMGTSAELLEATVDRMARAVAAPP